jgi:hypothetical protein
MVFNMPPSPHQTLDASFLSPEGIQNIVATDSPELILNCSFHFNIFEYIILQGFF